MISDDDKRATANDLHSPLTDSSSAGAEFGLTSYGEPCSDPCKHRGFPYTWCHKRASRNGTWIDRDYCSAGPGVTRDGEIETDRLKASLLIGFIGRITCKMAW